MTRYLSVQPIQEPFDLGDDDAGRGMIAFNVACETAGPSPNAGRELAKVLQDAGVGTYATDIFVSSRVNLPAGDGPYLVLIESGGPNPERIHNEALGYARPTVQVIVHSRLYPAGRAMVDDAYRALAAVSDEDVTV